MVVEPHRGRDATDATIPGVIRHADPERDAAACAAIYTPYVEDGVASFELTAPTPDEMGARISSASRTHAWLIAERDGEPAGYAYATPHHPRAAYRWAADVAVYVDGRRRRSGVGRELYQALLPLLTRQRIHIACAGVTLPNDASVGLHEAFGFEPVGVYRGVGFKFGAWHDVGWWQLRLLPPTPEPEEPLGPQRLDGQLRPP
jgi:L-amino acid N-acyltransferase YncA